MDSLNDFDRLLARYRTLPMQQKYHCLTTWPADVSNAIQIRLVDSVERLTRERAKQALTWRPESQSMHDSIMIEAIKSNPEHPLRNPIILVRNLQVLDCGAVRNLDRLELGFATIAKHFEYGVYADYAKPRRGITMINAWLFGLNWEQIFTARNARFAFPFLHDAQLTFEYSLEEWQLYLQHQLPACKQRINYLEVERAVQRLLFQDEGGVYRNFQYKVLNILLVEVNRYGLVYDWPNHHDLPVYHLRHLALLPEWPDYQLEIERGDRRPSYLIEYLRSAEHDKSSTSCSPLLDLKYPRFDKTRWYLYPLALKRQILTILYMQRCRRANFPLNRDLLPMLLDAIVTSFYIGAEERLKEWKILAEKYYTLSTRTLVDRAMDVLITSNPTMPDHVGLACRLASYVMGSASNVDGWKHVVKIAPDGKLGWHQCGRLLETVYDNRLCMSLIKNGKILIDQTGNIADLEAAKRLSEEKHARRRKLETDFRQLQFNQDGRLQTKRNRSDDEDYVP